MAGTLATIGKNLYLTGEGILQALGVGGDALNTAPNSIIRPDEGAEKENVAPVNLAYTTARTITAVDKQLEIAGGEPPLKEKVELILANPGKYGNYSVSVEGSFITITKGEKECVIQKKDGEYILNTPKQTWMLNELYTQLSKKVAAEKVTKETDAAVEQIINENNLDRGYATMDISKLKIEQAKLKGQVGGLKNKIAATNKSLENKYSRIATLSASLADLEAQLAKAKKTKKIEKEITDKTEEIAALENEIGELTKLLVKQEADLRQGETNLEAVKEEISQKETEKKELKNKVNGQ